jgi:hypothetical protein
VKDKKFLALSSFFFLLFAAAMSTILISQPTSQVLRAKNVAPSPLKSFGVVFPQVGAVKKENKETASKIKVSVFVRDVNGSVLSGRTIKLAASPSTLDITPADTQTTDNIGQAQFFVTSTTPGQIKLEALDVGSNTKIVNIPTVEFTE